MLCGRKRGGRGEVGRGGSNTHKRSKQHAFTSKLRIGDPQKVDKMGIGVLVFLFHSAAHVNTAALGRLIV